MRFNARFNKKLPDILLKRFTAPVDAASLAVFRILFGGMMLISMVRFIANGWVDSLYIQPSFYFPFFGFSWVQPWPAWGMYTHFVLLTIFSFLIAIGWFYRFSIIAFFFLFTYIELLDQTNYLNHYYFISLLSFLMIFCPLHRVFSVDALKLPSSSFRYSTVPAGILYLLRTQMGLVYLFAGIAKLNSDWLLHAQPLNIWLTAKTDFPILGWFFGQVWVHYFMSWASVIFELSVVPLLLWKRSRRWIYGVLVTFHVITGLLFNIGMFPWIMIVVTTLFFEPDWPRRIKFILSKSSQGSLPIKISTSTKSFKPSRIWITAACLFLLLQILIPFRHFLYPGNVLWTEEGMRFSWKVMLVEKTGHVEFRVHDPQSAKTWSVAPSDYLEPRQEKMMSTRPDMILRMAHHIEKDFRQRGYSDVQVYGEAYVSLNGRPSAPLINSDQDLTQYRESWLPQSWILPEPLDRPSLLVSPAYFALSPQKSSENPKEQAPKGIEQTHPSN